MSRHSRATRLLTFHFEGTPEPLFMTATHPVWNVKWLEWVVAGRLAAGDSIGTKEGARRIECVEVAKAGATVYNLTLAGGQTYFVGSDKVWVHNTWCGLDKLVEHAWNSHSDHFMELGMRSAVDLKEYIVAMQVRSNTLWKVLEDGASVMYNKADNVIVFLRENGGTAFRPDGGLRYFETRH